MFLIGIGLIISGSLVQLKSPMEEVPFSAGEIKSIGYVLFSRYLFPFEVASILLLVALIGTVYLAKRRVE
jgi:NADH-quinone oxidoreductase subunit J